MGEINSERETLIYWLLRAYQSGHRQGWESGPTTDETLEGILDVLSNRGYAPSSETSIRLLTNGPGAKQDALVIGCAVDRPLTAKV